MIYVILTPSYNRVCDRFLPPSFVIEVAAFSSIALPHLAKVEDILEVKLYVGNMSYDTTEAELRTMFAEAGSVITVDVIKDRMTGTSKGFAFITMSSQAEAAKAISIFNGKEVGGRALTVNTAKPREERSSGGRPYQGSNRGGSNRRY
jgi:RNA recognition motif-containing protein